jgi:hypothetical protein
MRRAEVGEGLTAQGGRSVSMGSERGETARSRSAGELRWRRPGFVAGVAVIAPGRIPAGLDLGYEELCRCLGECLLDPDADPSMIVACSQGYAVLALASQAGILLSVLTTEVDKAATALVMWASGIAYDEDFALTTDTVIAWLFGWPIPLVFDPTVGEAS